MEIYIKDQDGKLQETTLSHLLNKAFVEAGFEMDNGSWEKEDHNWLGIVQENKISTQVTTNITFKNDGNTITGLNVYVTPILRIVDDDNCEKII